MIKICEKFATENNLKFSTNVDPVKSKTKCIHFSKQNIELAKITLNWGSVAMGGFCKACW